MSLDDLKISWRSMQRQCDTVRIDEIANRIGSRMSRFDRSIRRRDTIENLAAFFVVVMFSIILFNSSDWVTFIGASIVILAAIVIVVILNVTRLYYPTPAGLSIKQHCQLELAKVDRQIFLLRNVVWWYVGPLMLGCCVMSFADGPFVASLISCGIYVAIGFFVYWINQRAVAENLLPLQQELRAAIETYNENLNEDHQGESNV